MYTSLNQYHVVMEAAPEFWQNPQFLHQVYVSAPNGGQVPLSALAHYEPDTAPLTVNHQGLFPAVTISFNLAPGMLAGRGGRRDSKAADQYRLTQDDQHAVRGHSAGVSGLAGERTVADRRRAGGGLSGAGHPV